MFSVYSIYQNTHAISSITATQVKDAEAGIPYMHVYLVVLVCSSDAQLLKRTLLLKFKAGLRVVSLYVLKWALCAYTTSHTAKA